MSSDFIDQLAKELNLSEAELGVLNQADARTAEDVDSLVSAFPSLAGRVRLPLLSNAVGRRLRSDYVDGVESRRARPPRNGLGADAPPGSLVTRGTVVGVVPPSAFTPAPSPLVAVDLRVHPWPVRNQQGRGTCVAHATTACVEHMQFAAEGRASDYSEQFLYWAIKDHRDPNRNQDSTLLQYARDTLQSDGICHETLCAYDGNIPTPVSGPDPGGAAKADAAAHMYTPGAFMQRPSGAARTVLQLLHNGRPVAVSLPVFTDPTDPNGPNNWMTSVACSYGRILNPPPGAVASAGHCVCVTGFVPDAGEPNGGYFIFRNSWDSYWAAAAPSPGSSYSPEHGYGEVSATYVNTYCWELLQI